jgi:hypothetical protein
MTNGPAALRKIAEANAHFVDFQGVGSRELTHITTRPFDRASIME